MLIRVNLAEAVDGPKVVVDDESSFLTAVEGVKITHTQKKINKMIL